MNLHFKRTDIIKKERIDSYRSDQDSQTITETEQRGFYLVVCALLLSAAAFAVSGFNITYSPIHHMVVVDMNHLLRQKAADIVNQQSDQKAERITELKLVEHARHVRETIEEYAAKNHVIVVTKGAVFGSNVKDVTHEISTLL